MPSVSPLKLLGAGESTVSSWKTGVETSSCLMGLNKVQHNIHSEAKQMIHSMIHSMQWQNATLISIFRAPFAKLLRAEMLRAQKRTT